MRMLSGSGKVTFCKLTDLEKRGSVSGETKGGTLLDHRMWIVMMIPSIHEGADFYRAPQKILDGRTMFCDTLQ